MNVVNILLMESGCEADFHDKRLEVRSMTEDQGTEKTLAGQPLSLLPRFHESYSSYDPRMFKHPLC